MGGRQCRVIAGGTRGRLVRAFAMGGRHLYLYDTETGALIRQLTSGPYNVAEIAHVDERPGCLLHGGRPGGGSDPYHASSLSASPRWRSSRSCSPRRMPSTRDFSPSGSSSSWTPTRGSTLPPVTRLRRRRGWQSLELERADVEALLATGWRSPERFSAKARDGVTDVYGVIFRPSRFDAEPNLPGDRQHLRRPQREPGAGLVRRFVARSQRADPIGSVAAGSGMPRRWRSSGSWW